MYFYFRDDPHKQTRKQGKSGHRHTGHKNRSLLAGERRLKESRKKYERKCVVWGPLMQSWFYRIELKENYGLFLCLLPFLFNLWIPRRYIQYYHTGSSVFVKTNMFFFFIEGHNNWVEGAEREGYIQRNSRLRFSISVFLQGAVLCFVLLTTYA